MGGRQSLSVRVISYSLVAMKRRSAAWLLLSLTLSQITPACAEGQQPVPPTWKRVHAGAAFSFNAPGNVKAIPVRAFDSFVRAYVADGFSLTFDYGHDADSLSGAAEWDRIDGRRSKYESAPTRDCEAFPGDKTEGKYEASIYVVRSRNLAMIPPMSLNIYMRTTALNMHGCARDQRALRDLQHIFRSIRFGPG